MEKKEVKKIIVKGFIWILSAIGMAIIGIIINSIFSNINLWESTKKIVEFLFHPNFGLLILILIIFKLVYTLNQKNKYLSNRVENELSEKNINEILTNNKRFIKLLDEFRDKANRIIKINEALISENEGLKHLKIALENLEPKNEVLFILETIANIPNKTEKLSNIKALYTQKFNKEMSDLQIILDEIENLQFIEETECGEFGEICYSILSKGLRFLKQNRMKDSTD